MRRAVDNQLDGPGVDELMHRALQATAGTLPHPNPRVGAVIVNPQGEVLSVAAHEGPGTPHAERLALEGLDDVTGHTLVVTLEPCNHHGRTPPCTDAIIEAGISRVIVGTRDPDPQVRGRGIERLQDAGIDVIESALSGIVEANDPVYFANRRAGTPFVTLKLAMTLDGQIAAADGTSRWISGPQARSDAHRLRAAHDAVLVGAGTLRSDDPQLTVRLEGYDGPQPRPVILKGHSELPTQAHLYERNPLVIQGTGASGADVDEVLDQLAVAGIRSVLIEGGARIARSFLESGAVDDLVVYIGAKLAAGTGRPAIDGVFATITDAIALEITDVRTVGSDVRITAYIGGRN
ncbi:MAG: bifunctional diaminohydroxyphosphoribosylaminopyrimidine deaminase/5-amino-6-(5-phosphoribosylamino)uracil reductase RibD [Actinomycetia bacterium]|nr:bifunctional diaminohydroxyphosphoribosylaminopyrimidine deaminase/5-amino-6-(5-phosphoribosylamino)uracil reductase RibD [Actinomycetes bacterium]